MVVNGTGQLDRIKTDIELGPLKNNDSGLSLWRNMSQKYPMINPVKDYRQLESIWLNLLDLNEDIKNAFVCPFLVTHSTHEISLIYNNLIFY